MSKEDLISLEKAEQVIYLIRGEKVMLDRDLALLYGVETKTLNRAVKRNLQRFPLDFMFQLTEDEAEDLRCQIGTSNKGVVADGTCPTSSPSRVSRCSQLC